MFLSEWSSKTLQKCFEKEIVSKSFFSHGRIKFDQKSKTDFFLDFFLSRFWAFLDEETNLTLVLFWPLTHPHTTGVTDCFFGGPLGELKNATDIFLQNNIMSKKSHFSFSRVFLVLSRCLGALLDRDSKTPQKRHYKKSMPKQKIDKTSSACLFRVFLAFFFAFLGEGSSKTP
jgi:hypothetical protein